MHDKGLTFWLALDDADEVNGCMYYGMKAEIDSAFILTE